MLSDKKDDFNQYAQNHGEEYQDQPRHVSEVLHSIINNWPAERREAFYKSYQVQS